MLRYDDVFTRGDAAVPLQTRRIPFSPQIVYRPKVNARFESAARDCRRFAETHPPGATSCGGRLFAAGSLRPRVQRHPVSFAEQEVYILEVAFIVAACITRERKKKSQEGKRTGEGGLRIPLSVNPADAGLKPERRWRNDPFPLRRTYRYLSREKIFISHIVGLLPKHVRKGEKARKRLLRSGFTRTTRERDALLSRNARPGYRALMGGRSEK